ncbi:unnamed protein product, partial [Urochloa humidicola]
EKRREREKKEGMKRPRGETGAEEEKRGKRKLPGEEAGAAGEERFRSPRRSQSRRCRRGRSRASPYAGASPPPSPPHLSYDPEDYFDYFNHDYTGEDFSEEYNYSE